VAVLIMAVSLTAAWFAFLDSQAGNRGASASRRAEAAGVEVLREAGIREREIGQELIVYGYSNDAGWISVALSGSNPVTSLSPAMAAAYDAARTQAATFSAIMGSEYQLPDGNIEWMRFVEESRRPAYRAMELQKAHSEVVGVWNAKSAKFVAVITMLAAALFLLGLTVSVVQESQLTLVATGVGLAVIATLWGLAVWVAPVPVVSERAIDAYLDGAITTYHSQEVADLQFAERRLGDAIEADPRYREAYMSRGYTRFQLDLADPDGPQGSLEVVDDFEVALDLDPNDAVAWTNLGAAWFWLDDYAAAEVATRRALELDPDEPTVNLNLAFLFAITDDSGYEAQLELVHDLLVDMPFWQRQLVVVSYLDVLELGETYRPDVFAEADAMYHTLQQMDREITVGRRFFGSPVATPVGARLSPPDFTLSEDGTGLRLEFSYAGIEPGQRFIYRTFLDGVESDLLSLGSADPWQLAVPDGEAFIELTLDAGFRGHTVRVEFYIEGNLLAIGEFSS
jgi:tetratricopeptide (TPR) repeat protein